MKGLSLQLFAFLFLGTILCFGQDKRENDNSINRVSSDIYQYTQDVTNFLQISQIEGFNALGSASNTQNGGNIAIIQQVGVGNTLSTQTNSQSSDMRYLQVGLRNNIESINTINNASQRIIQLGIDNEFIHDSFGNITTSNLNVLQTGTGLNFQKVGSNTQTQDMTVRMSGQDRTVIVRSN